MKEYRGCKYYDKVEEINSGLFEGNSVILPVVHIIATIGEGSVPISTGISIEDIVAKENPNEYLEQISKEAIDKFVDLRDSKKN